MKRHAMLIELSVYERILPLASGYLQAYAGSDSELAKAYTFEHYSTTAKTPFDELLATILASPADVYAFGCYVWNMGLIKRLLPRIRAARPQAAVLLGGPQVMHQSARYVSAEDEHTYVCNGEGERTFAGFLRQLEAPKPDFSSVKGLSFHRDRTLVTTEEQPRITNLDEIPSPFLTGVFKKHYSTGIIETNRGCPFRCGFCFWGAHTNDRVFKFDEERVHEELTWLSRHDTVFLYIADANWGMLTRDVGLSKHLAECTRRHQLPSVVYFSAAKNSPERVTEITEIFATAGIISSQPVSMQSVDERSLELIERTNIKLDAFHQLQRKLDECKLNSFVELIWPLPGETLRSFEDGIDKLCEAAAQTIIVYPHLLLNNTPLFDKREQLDLTTIRARDELAEAELVVSTADATYEDFREGMWFFYGLHALHNTRSLHALFRHLTATREIRRKDVISAFVHFAREERPDHPVVAFWRRSIEDVDFYDVFNNGLAVHLVLHQFRAEFDRLVREFASRQEWWSQVEQVLYELDLLNKPYVYSNTPVAFDAALFEHLTLVRCEGRAYVVEIPARWAALARVHTPCEPGDEGRPVVWRVDHRRSQYPFMAAQTIEHNAGYCHGMIERISSILPAWKRAAAFVR